MWTFLHTWYSQIFWNLEFVLCFLDLPDFMKSLLPWCCFLKYSFIILFVLDCWGVAHILHMCFVFAFFVESFSLVGIQLLITILAKNNYFVLFSFHLFRYIALKKNFSQSEQIFSYWCILWSCNALRYQLFEILNAEGAVPSPMEPDDWCKKISSI